MLGPGTSLYRSRTVWAGTGFLFASVYDLAVLATACSLGFCIGEWDGCVRSITSAVAQQLAVAIIEVIECLPGALRM